MQNEDLSIEEAFDWDDSKLVIFAERAGMTGDELHQILLKKYHLQMEMVSGYYVLGMTSLMDEDEGLERLAGTLHEIDAKLAEDVSNGNKILKNPTSDEKYHSFIEKIYQKYPREMQIYQAEELHYTRFRMLDFTTETDFTRITGEHEEIFRLICEKDEKGLEKALKDHLYFSMKRMRHAIEVDYKDYFEEEPEEGRFVI